jgi:hypothetical protein
MTNLTIDRTAKPTNAQLDAWLSGIQTFVTARGRDVTLSFDTGGKRYLRVVENRAAQRSVFCFIEIETGNILKADGWKTPAKGARGHILDANHSIGRGISEYGATYRYR